MIVECLIEKKPTVGSLTLGIVVEMLQETFPAMSAATTAHEALRSATKVPHDQEVRVHGQEHALH